MQLTVVPLEFNDITGWSSPHTVLSVHDNVIYDQWCQLRGVKVMLQCICHHWDLNLVCAAAGRPETRIEAVIKSPCSFLFANMLERHFQLSIERNYKLQHMS